MSSYNHDYKHSTKSFWQDNEYHETEEPEYEVVNISPVDVKVLERLEDKLKDAMIRRDNRMGLEEGILEHISNKDPYFLELFDPSLLQPLAP